VLGTRAYPSFGRTVSTLAHDSSTLGGNSGSAVVDVSSGRVVGLHFAGEYRDANYAVPAYELARDGFVRDAGVSFGSGTAANPNPWADAWTAAESAVEARPIAGLPTTTVGAASSLASGFLATSSRDRSPAEITLSIPVDLAIRLGSAASSANGITITVDTRAGETR
jgi:hypothetical protein